MDNAKTLFKPSNWLAKIDFINHLALLNNIMIAVLAKPRAGKTSFIKLLGQKLDDSIQSMVWTAPQPFSEKQFIDNLQGFFHWENPCATIVEVIKKINEEKKHCLIIIDDAQNIPLNFLQEVLMAMRQYENRNFFHICLVADFSLTVQLTLLDKEHFTDLIHTIELCALTENETKTYIIKKLPPSKSLTNQELSEIYQKTQGEIASIDSNIQYLLQEKAKVQRMVKIPPAIKWGGIVASWVLVAFLSNYFWQNQVKEIPPIKAPSPNLVAKVVELPLKSQIPALSVAKREEVQPAPLNKIVSFDDEDSHLEQLVVSDSVIVPNAMYRLYPKKTTYPVSSLVEIGTLEPKKTLAETVAVQQVVPAALVKETKETQVVQRVQKAILKNGYTIQLMASQKKNDLKHFMSIHHITDNATIQVATRQGRDWFVLTMGEFSQRRLAKTALDELPQTLAQLHPWIRPLKDLKAQTELTA